MKISPETHILVGDIAYRMAAERDADYEAAGDHASYYVAGILHCEGFRQYLSGISKTLDEFEAGMDAMDRAARRRWLRKGLVTQSPP